MTMYGVYVGGSGYGSTSNTLIKSEDGCSWESMGTMSNHEEAVRVVKALTIASIPAGLESLT